MAEITVQLNQTKIEPGHIVEQLYPGTLNFDEKEPEAYNAKLRINTLMSNRTQDLASAPPESVSWENCQLSKLQPLAKRSKNLSNFDPPRYKHWDIFAKESETLDLDITCF